MSAGRRLVLLVLVGAILAPLAGCGGGDATVGRPARRVLVFTMPGTTWGEVRRSNLPHLRSLVRDSAVGEVSTRIGNTGTSSTAAYLTLGSGTRAVAPTVDTGVALNPDEDLAGVPADEILQRRLGDAPGGIAYIPVGASIDANKGSPWGAEPGTLGDALEAGGVDRAVIANADAAEGFPSDELPADGAYARSAATALMGSDGIVPGGDVGRDLLQDDPDAPFGRRLDPAKVQEAFRQSWDGPDRKVVLVEASDLARAAAYARRASPTQAARLRAEALKDADALLGRLLRQTDPKRDAVLVVAPIASSGLGIAILRTPDVHAGLLRSATTRRAGYVYLADVAPTVLRLLGEDQPRDIEGRAFDVSEASGDRVGDLIGQARDAANRDERLPVVVTVLIAFLVLLTAATRWPHRCPQRLRPLLRPAAIGALGLVPGTFLASLVPATHTNGVVYAVVVAAVGLVIGVVGWWADRWRPGLGPFVGVGALLLLIAGDVLLGAPLQVNTVFGYSMAVAGRFTGLGNLAFALFGAAVVAFGVLLVDRYGRRALPLAGAIFVAAVLIDGLPMLGADVGGVVATVPAYLLCWLALSGRRFHWRDVAATVAAGFVVVIGFGILDSSRPGRSQTHLARLGQHVADGRLGLVDDVLLRRLHASFGDQRSSTVILCLAIVMAAIVQAVLVDRGVLGPRARRRPFGPIRSALAVGFGTLATLGLVANDSSIAVPATMLLVVVPVLLLRQHPPAPEPVGASTPVETSKPDELVGA